MEEVRSRLVTLYRSLARYHPRRVLDERRRRLDDVTEALRQRLQSRMQEQRSELRECELRLRQGIAGCVSASKLRLTRADERLWQGSRAFLLARRNRLERLNVTLHELDPKRILHRGFAMAEHLENGRLVTSSRNVTVGDLLRIRFAEGAAVGQIQEVEDPDRDHPKKET